MERNTPMKRKVRLSGPGYTFVAAPVFAPAQYAKFVRLIGALSFTLVMGLIGCSSDGSGTDPAAAGYVYVTATTSAGAPGALYQFTVGSNGSVTPMQQASISTGVYPTAVAADPGGHYIYVSNGGDGTVSQYTVGAGGALSPMNPATIVNPGMKALGTAPSAATVDPSGHFAYVANWGDDTVSQFSIGSGGQLTPLTPATVATGKAPVSITVDSSGHYAYVANSGQSGVQTVGTVTEYSIGADGTLTPLNPASVSAAGTFPLAITIDRDGTSAFIMSDCNGGPLCTGSIAQFALGSDGVLSATGAATNTGNHIFPTNMVIDEAGTHAYVLTDVMGVDTGSGELWQFGVGTSGALAADSPPMLSSSQVLLAQSLVGSSLFVLTWNYVVPSGAIGGGGIARYTIGTGGLLTFADSTPLTAANPTSMVYVSGQH
jgi:DNA-binding beta-propeller fold protein YncE